MRYESYIQVVVLISVVVKSHTNKSYCLVLDVPGAKHRETILHVQLGILGFVPVPDLNKELLST